MALSEIEKSDLNDFIRHDRQFPERAPVWLIYALADTPLSAGNEVWPFIREHIEFLVKEARK